MEGSKIGTILALLMISLITHNTVQAEIITGRAVDGGCIIHDPNTATEETIIDKEECVVFDIGTHFPGEKITFQIDITSTIEWDFLILEEGDFQEIYAKDNQGYSDLAIEYSLTMFGIINLQQIVTWEAEECGTQVCNFVAIIDNRDFIPSQTSRVSDAGTGEGSITLTTLEVITPLEQETVIVNDVFVGEGGISNPEIPLGSFDANTRLTIEATALKGSGDVYPLTSSGDMCGNKNALNNLGCLSLYKSTNNIGDLFLTSGSTYHYILVYSTPEANQESEGTTIYTTDTEDESRTLAVVIDTQDRGDAGDDSEIDFVVYVKITILAPLEARGEIVGGNKPTEIGNMIEIDTSESPNSSGQINSRHWYIDEEKCPVNNGVGIIDIGTCEITSNEYIMKLIINTPKIVQVKLEIEGKNNQKDIWEVSIVFSDTTPPEIIDRNWIEGVGDVNREYLFEAEAKDNHSLSTYSWELKDINGMLLDTEQGEIKAPITTDFETIPSYVFENQNIGTYSIILKVNDNSGNLAKIERTFSIEDRTPPVVTNTKASKSTAFISEKITLNAGEVTSNNPDLVSYCWDTNPEQDSNDNGDPVDDCNLQGKTVEVTSQNPGQYTYTLTVSNENGISTRRTISVIFSEPEPWFSIWMVAVPLIALIAAGGFIGYRRFEDEKMMKSIAEAKRIKDEIKLENEQKNAENPELQKAMFSKSSKGSNREYAVLAGEGGIKPSRQAAELEMARLAGFEPVQQGIKFDDLLDDDDDNSIEIEAVNRSDEFDIEKLPSTSFANDIDGLDDLLNSFDPYNQQKQDNYIDNLSQQAYSTHRAECANCSRRFAIDLATEITEAIVDCPHCNTRQRFKP